ncbi:plasmid replication protein RepC [Aliiroseovarius sp.]|uniref:plasmid replication protein RepC n=1 Tax=Aliiroseovarius sp. TaxID=1872442 RepID=UPI003BAB80F1
MEILTTTPFGRRPVTAGLIERAQAAQAAPAVPHCDKWELFRTLCTARVAMGVTDRDLTVLNALLSFHPEPNLSDNTQLVVFPSNKALSERAHGMAESTLRRHLAALVKAGLIARHDSPNGKRYAARDGEGTVTRAFGFDLRPLLVRAGDIAQAAQAARDAEARLKRLREEVMVMKRDAVKLSLFGQETAPGPLWAPLEARLLDIHKQTRRKLDMDALEALRAEVQEILTDIRVALSETEKMHGNDSENERHYQNSNTETLDSEFGFEKHKVAGVETDRPRARPSQTMPNLPLGLVLKACPDILPYATHEVTNWHELVALAALVRGMMGISPDAWAEAVEAMGPEVAAITVAGILQRVSDIKSPGGYLRALSRKAAVGAFSPGPMIMALLQG